MQDEFSALQAVVIFLLAAVLAVPLAKRLQLGAVIGYLLAGIAIGPAGLGLIGDPEGVSHLSEFGVVMLLFIIGLELSPRRLWVMRRSVFGGGALQVLLTGLVIGLIAQVGFGYAVNTAIVLGLGLALSSTAFGLQILAERRELTAPHGRFAFAILLFQDIAAIPLIALVPMLSGVHDDAPHDWHGMATALASIGAVIIGGRYLLRPVFRIVARTRLREVSTATALLVVVGTAWLMELAGVSMALGAFLAGLLLADSEYRHELESQIEPFKGLLLGLFFICVGMQADIALLLHEPLRVLLLTALVIGLKLPLLYVVGRRAGGLARRHALRLGVVLAAGGEFAFVVFQLAQRQGLFDLALYNLLVLAITLSMAATPLLMMATDRLIRARTVAPEVPPEYRQIDAGEPRVVIAGMGRMGQIMARVLQAQHIPYIALDTSVESIELSRSIANMPIFYGSPRHPEILRAVKVGSAEFFVAAIDDAEECLRIVETVRAFYPQVKIIARARNRRHAHRLTELGATAVRETFHSSLEMSRLTLLGLGLGAAQASERIERFRRHDEQVMEAQYRVRDNQSAMIQTAREARAELETLFDADTADDRAADGEQRS